MKILCVGHATYDVVIPVESFPIENTKNRIGGSISCSGGPACNAASLLGKWGMDTYFCGLVGNDYYGNVIKKELENVNVNTDFLFLDQDYKTTKSYLIVNKKNASRTALSCQSEKKYLNSIDINIKPDIILIDGQEFELSKEFIKKNSQATVIIDAGRCTDEVVQLCKLCDYVVCSKTFALEYAKTDNLEETLKILNNDFKGKVIVTLEKEGCAYYNKKLKIIKSVPLDAVDTTGAGDIFHGAFTYGIAQNWDLDQILEFSNTTASLSITKFTGRKSIYPLEKVLEAYNELKRRNFY